MVTILPVSSPTAYARLSASELLDIMKLSLGGKGSRADKKDLIIKNAISRAADLVWYWANWSWRCLPYTLTTVANQAYTTLPTDFRKERIVKELWFNDDPAVSAALIRGDLWEHRLRIVAGSLGSSATGRPLYCAVKLDTISGEDKFVMKWSPTPDQVYTLKGFEYYKTLPALDFTSTDPVFPESEFDMLWQAASYRWALNQGLQVGDATDNQRVMSRTEFTDMMTKAADRWALPDATNVPLMPEDLYGDLADFASNEQPVL